MDDIRNTSRQAMATPDSKGAVLAHAISLLRAGKYEDCLELYDLATDKSLELKKVVDEAMCQLAMDISIDVCRRATERYG